MKANELMLGDWVVLTDPIHQGEKVQVKAIPDDGHIIVDGGIMPLFDPIPLTTEILEKIGFDVSDKEVMQYHFEEDGEKYHFSLRQMYDKDGTPHGYSFYAFNVLTIIDYVHELQHALRLCGIEKEIEL